MVDEEEKKAMSEPFYRNSANGDTKATSWGNGGVVQEL
jgi:hypothetical protein